MKRIREEEISKTVEKIKKHAVGPFLFVVKAWVWTQQKLSLFLCPYRANIYHDSRKLKTTNATVLESYYLSPGPVASTHPSPFLRSCGQGLDETASILSSLLPGPRGYLTLQLPRTVLGVRNK